MSFSDDMLLWAEQTENSMHQVIKATALSIFSDVILSTPVDTGRARGNWQFTTLGPAIGVVGHTASAEPNAPTTGGSRHGERIALQVERSNTDGYYLTNNLPYIRVLEYGGYPGDGPKTVGGFSKQAPAGMVRKNAARHKQRVADAVREHAR